MSDLKIISESQLNEFLKLVAEESVKKSFADINENISSGEQNYKDALKRDEKRYGNLVAEAEQLEEITLKEFIQTNENKHINLIALEEVTDPRNIGSIIRSAVAFNMDGIIVKERSYPFKSKLLYKSASGGTEHIKIFKVSNINTTLKYLRDKNFWIYGFDANSEKKFNDYVDALYDLKTKRQLTQDKDLQDAYDLEINQIETDFKNFLQTTDKLSEYLTDNQRSDLTNIFNYEALKICAKYLGYTDNDFNTATLNKYILSHKNQDDYIVLIL